MSPLLHFNMYPWNPLELEFRHSSSILSVCPSRNYNLITEHVSFFNGNKLKFLGIFCFAGFENRNNEKSNTTIVSNYQYQFIFRVTNYWVSIE